MQFNSYNYILYFIPICMLLYYTLGHINKIFSKIVLVFGSLIVYGFYGLDTLQMLILSLLFNYLFLIIIQKQKLKKFFIVIPIIVNIFLLFYFKYLNFAILNINTLFGSAFKLQSIILPVGISFFTFQQIAYIVAVSHREIQSLSLIDYTSYILFFPKLIMGPLMDPVDFENQINDKNISKLNIDNLACGIKIFSFGLLKKYY